jgi:SAM-dependent methyltransferase
MTHTHSDRPSPWIERFASLVAPGGRVLDLACGHGRHARFFAARGCDVVAIDRDADAIATLAGVERIDARVHDLERNAWPLAGERFAAIVVTQYLHRPLFEHLFAALAPDGAFLYETFAHGNEAYGRPSNPDFLLAPGELLERCAQTLTIVAFEQGRTDAGGRSAVMERVAAVGPARPWPPPLAAP